MTDLPNAINYNEIFEQLMLLTLSIYTPSHYILPSKIEKYAELFGDDSSLTQKGREEGICRLMAINLMKRMESSVYSFTLTLNRIKDQIDSAIRSIDAYDRRSPSEVTLTDLSQMGEFDSEDQNDDLFSFGRKVKIALGDIRVLGLSESLPPH